MADARGLLQPGAGWATSKRLGSIAELPDWEKGYERVATGYRLGYTPCDELRQNLSGSH